MKKTIRKNERGITLIALIITIIVLIILAGISIMMISGNDGILARAGNAKVTIGQATAEEEVKRAIMSLQIDGKGSNNGITPAKIAEQVNKDNGRTDVTAEGENFPTNIVYGNGTKVYVNLDLTIGKKKENKIYSVDVDEKDIHDDIFVYDEFVKASETEISSTGTLDELPKNTAVITGIKPEYTQTFRGSIGDDIFYGYEIKYSEVTNTLVIPSTVEKDCVQYTIIGVDLSQVVEDKITSFPDIENVIFPNTIKTIKVTDEGKGCNLATVTNVVLPEYITELPNNMFGRCINIKNINIPNTVTKIGEGAFYGCSSLESIKIPDTVTSMGEYINFSECSSLTSITIPDGVKGVDEVFFANCSSLTSITIPDGVKNIGIWAFGGCSSLQSITIPNGVTSIGNNAFYGCSSLQSITIPNGVTSIGNLAFYGCSSLQNITIPDSVTVIEYDAFSGCSSLQSIKIPDKVIEISSDTFNGCSSLQSITIPNGVTSIGNNAFDGCSSLQSITIPNSVTSIWNSAFYGCSSLQNITIPESVTSIGSAVFYGCSSLQNITIPESVTKIGNRVFDNCTSLNKITINKPKGSLDYSNWGLQNGTTIVWNDGEEVVE